MAPCAKALTDSASCTASICRRNSVLTCPRPMSNMNPKGTFPHHDWPDNVALSRP
jgi:hypothetical protein